MIELVIMSRLLEYPDAALWQHQQEMFEQTRYNHEFNHACGSVLLVTSMASMRRLLNRLN